MVSSPFLAFCPGPTQSRNSAEYSNVHNGSMTIFDVVALALGANARFSGDEMRALFLVRRTA
jgi:hypothetical protein